MCTKFTTDEALQFVLDEDDIRHKTCQLCGKLWILTPEKNANFDFQWFNKVLCWMTSSLSTNCYLHSGVVFVTRNLNLALVATPQKQWFCEVWEVQSGTKQFGVRYNPAQNNLGEGTIRHKTVWGKVQSGTNSIVARCNPAQNHFERGDIRHKMGLDGVLSGTQNWL